MQYLERLALFERRFPEPFLRDTVTALEALYPETFTETLDLPFDYQRYLRPHMLRTKAEIAFLTSARRNGLAAEAVFNASRDAHALVASDPFVLTLSKTASPAEPPRPAVFRRLYASYVSLGQLPLDSPDFQRDFDPIEVRDQSPPIYVVISHGPPLGQYRDLGFIHANFVAPSGIGYFGPGIDLLDRFGLPARRRQVEEIEEPLVQPKRDVAQERDA